MGLIDRMKPWSHLRLIAYGPKSGLLIADYVNSIGINPEPGFLSLRAGARAGAIGSLWPEPPLP